MTIAELAHYLGVSVNTIYEWNSVGSGPAYYRVGRYVRYKKEDVEAWLEGRRVPSAQAS
jgi:excisionase family DNA binding protein